MADTPSYALLEQFSGFLARRLGLHFPHERWPDMLRRLERGEPGLGAESAAECMRRFLAEPLDQEREQALASCLTVGETYFYREPAVFETLEKDILPPLIAARRAAGLLRLGIWSAGCSTGEEPYSVAVLLTRLLPDISQWSITLLGTDLNSDFLAKAERGEYRQWSFRGAPPWLRREYFRATANGTYVLVPRVRRLVSFARRNLVDGVPSFDILGMDVVLCRNVLMYFESGAARVAVDRLRGALAEGGWLIVGSADASVAQLSGFSAVRFTDVTLYQKADRNVPEQARPVDAEWLSPATRLASTASQASSAPPAERRRAASKENGAYRRALASYARGDYATPARLPAEGAPCDVPGLALAARACANLGRLDDARRWCAAAVAADKTDPGLRYLLASILIERGCDEEAAVALGQTLYLDPDHVLAHFALANLLRRVGSPSRAARHVASARELLAARPPDQPLDDGDGLTAGRLLAIIDDPERTP